MKLWQVLSIMGAFVGAAVVGSLLQADPSADYVSTSSGPGGAAWTNIDLAGYYIFDTPGDVTINDALGISGNTILNDPGTSAASYSLTWQADQGGTVQSAQAQMIQDASTPYFQLVVTDQLGVPSTPLKLYKDQLSITGDIRATYFGSASGTLATVGIFRLENNTSVSWASSPAGTNCVLYVDTTETLVYSCGNMQVALGSLAVNAAGGFVVSGRNVMASPADGQWQWGPNGFASGIRWLLGTDTVTLRNFAGTADGALNAGAIAASGTITKTVGTKGATTVTSGAEETLTCAGGGSATLTTSGLIPDGAWLVGVTTRITTALTGSTGFNVGDGSDADLYGVQAAATQGSTTTNASATANWANPQLSAGEITLTFSGGNCTAGAVLVVAHYSTVTAPTSN